MAAQQHHPANEFQQLRTEAAQIRLRAIRSQIAIGLTFCSVAECELQSGRDFSVHSIVEKLRKQAETMRRHLDEPNHVPPNEVDSARADLAVLESRILALEESEQRSS